MPRVECVRNALQCLNYDLSTMLANHRSNHEIVAFLAKRMRFLTNPPGWLILDWNTDAQHKWCDVSDDLKEEDNDMMLYDELSDNVDDVLLYEVKQ